MEVCTTLYWGSRIDHGVFKCDRIATIILGYVIVFCRPWQTAIKVDKNVSTRGQVALSQAVYDQLTVPKEPTTGTVLFVFVVGAFAHLETEVHAAGLMRQIEGAALIGTGSLQCTSAQHEVMPIQPNRSPVENTRTILLV